MGYTVWYEGLSETPITPEQLAIARQNAAKWTTKLSDTAESYAWDIDDDDDCKLSGSTKPSLDMDELDDDVDTIVAAVAELDQALDGVELTVTDDHETDLYP